MEYICDAPDDRTWFRLVTEGEALAESEQMRHAVEKHFRREREKAADSFHPLTNVFIEQDIGKEAHIQREMPLFLTLRDQDGAPLVTAMLPPGGRATVPSAASSSGPANGDPYKQHGDAIEALADHFDIPLDRAALLSVSSGMNSTQEINAMGYTLEQFAAKCHDALKNQPGTAGPQGGLRAG